MRGRGSGEETSNGYVKVKLMKKLIAPLVLAAALALTGCGGESTAPAGAAGSKTTEEAPKKAPDLTGSWKQSNPNSETSYQQATVTADSITVEWVSDGGGTTSIYWVGTFSAPTDATEPYVWTSQRDAEATQSALMASSDDAKEFTYTDGTISYKVSALGTTTRVNLKKN
jgi:activator of HSP90 ATPase